MRHSLHGVRDRATRATLIAVARLAFVPALACVFASAATAAEHGERGERGWSLLLEPMYLDGFGHDQHVLTIHQRDLASAPSVDTRVPVHLDTDAGLSPRFELNYRRDDWTYGIDFFWFDSAQGRPTRSAAGGAAGMDEVIFEAADRAFASDDPGEVLVFAVLEDTDIIAWTVDVYAMRTLVQAPGGALRLQFGLRNADFDNDYHSLVALEGVGGTLFDASSNYPRMIGPLLGLAGETRLGGGRLRGYFGQSVIFGTAELSNDANDFVGPSSTPVVTAREVFHREQDVAIPITELRINWLYPLGRHYALGVSANASVWWDVPVPPGVVPGPGANRQFQENTILYVGLAVALQLEI